ncbi:hypothetical protein Aduo_001359 [Ancylostoma duodenale]
MTMTRGIPITAAVLGSLYYARTRLPAQYHFGPKGWPFYAIMGIGTLTTVNIFSMGKCRDRVQPLIGELWQKYHIGESSTSYDAIRRRHREEYGFTTPDSTLPTQSARKFGDMPSPADRAYVRLYDYIYCFIQTDPYSLGTETMQPMNTGMPSDNYERTFDMTTENSDQRKPPPQNYMYGMDAPSYMSGTPTTPRSSEFSR